MTSAEKGAIKYAVARIRSLARLENAGFSINAETDKVVKETVRPYLMWFDCVAFYLENLADAEDSYDRRSAIDAIMRYCN